MDALDVRIFCEMSFKYLDYNSFKDRHVSPTEIGQKLGLAEKTVRVRVRKMEDGGFIKYYQSIPNLSLFGLRSMALYSFEASDIPSKHTALTNFQQNSGIVEVFDMMGPAFLATLAGSSNLDVERQAATLRTNLELKGLMKVGDRTPPESSAHPDSLDWKIIQQLRYDALLPAKNLAKQLAITPRMAEYRIKKMLLTKALFIRAAINAQQQQGLIFFGLIISADPSKQIYVVERLRETYKERLWSLYTPMAGAIVANIFGFNVGEPEQAVMTTDKIKGVKQSTLTILKEILEPERPNWIDKRIQEKVNS